MSAKVGARRVRMLRPHRVLCKVGLYGGVALFLAAILLPIYYMALPALVPGSGFYTVPLDYFPSELTLDRFRHVSRALPLGRYLLNTAFLATTSTVIALLISFLAAYAIARYEFPGADLILMGLLLSSALPWASTLVPLFQMYQRLKLMDTMQGLLLLYVSALLPLTVWVLASFLRQIPREIEEAATVDGASLAPLLWRVVLPMLRPALATMFAINFIVNWNEFLIPLIFSRGPGSGVINTALANQFSGDWGSISTVAIISTIPVFVVTLLLQRQIVEGITAGAIR